jgi:5-bromo-4-chloroindolyl phosphate hydrolysis protein
VTTITQADNIVARWKLASYYAIVTPTERLRVRWEEYRESIREEYEHYIELQEQAIELKTKPVMTQKEETELKRINMQIENLDRQLVPDRVKFMKVDTLRTGAWQRRMR